MCGCTQTIARTQPSQCPRPSGAAMEAHQALQMVVPGIAAPPVSLRRAAADPVYAAIKGVDMDESGLSMGRSDSSELSV